MAKSLAIFLMGPTASGKTGIAVELVQRLPLEIISVDSALVYRGMDIGTAKPDAETLRLAPHRLLDIRDPTEPYSAAMFRHDALRQMQEVVAAGKVPLLAGGTMLYFRALEQGLSDLPSADPELRATLAAQARQHGWPAMHERLAGIDPTAARRIHPNDPQRIQRALEVYELTGIPLTELCQPARDASSEYHFLKVALAPQDRAVLHERIARRFDAMLKQGFLEEVRGLRERDDLHAELPAMRAVGYRQAWDYLDGRLTAGEWVDRAVIATRQYAKRQLTWLRSEENVHWVDPDEDHALRKISALIEAYGATAG